MREKYHDDKHISMISSYYNMKKMLSKCQRRYVAFRVDHYFNLQSGPGNLF